MEVVDMLQVNAGQVPTVTLIGYIAYTTPWIHFQRNTDEYVLYIIKNGELHLRENKVDYHLKRGDMLLLEPGLDLEGTKKSTCDYYYFHFKHPAMNREAISNAADLAKSMLVEEHAADKELLYYIPKYSTISDKSSLSQILHASNELWRLYLRKQHFNRGITALHLLELLIELSRHYFWQTLQQSGSKGSKAAVKVHALLDFIHQHYTVKMNSAIIEQEFDSNYDYLNRIFKELTGYTIAKYVNKVRIGHAQELIKATHISFSEIGYLIGLDDPYYFSKVFKQFTGLSPAQYYKQARLAQQ
jgi:AraC-like DNA-binding protein